MAKAKVQIDDHPQLPAMEDERDDVLIKAAKRYQALMLERKECGERESAAHERLNNLMHDKGLESYQYKGLQIFRETKEKCRVKNAATPSENGDE